MGRTRNRRKEPEERLPPQFEEIDITPEEVEVSDFLEGLGPQGISEVSLYRILPSGKQRFITSGPPSQFADVSKCCEGNVGKTISFAASLFLITISLRYGSAKSQKE